MSNSTQLDKSHRWQGRTDKEDEEKGDRWHHQISMDGNKGDIALLGYCCDQGVANNQGRIGAAEGPNSIRKALANYAWHGFGRVNDLGNLAFTTDLSDYQTRFSSCIENGLQNHSFVVALGGGHDIAWSSFNGLHNYLSKQSKRPKIGIINFDAHFDLRKPSPDASSGTPFYQIADYIESYGGEFHYACLGVAQNANTQALFERAEKLKVTYLLDKAFSLAEAKSKLAPMLTAVDHLYVTVCLDAFPASIAPGVSAPSSLGISANTVLQILQWLHNKQNAMNYSWQLMDVAEMNPNFDVDQSTARLAARLIYEVTLPRLT